MKKVLQPTYMKKFKCIGGACEDSCCIGWRVNLDKKTFQLYKNNKDEELKPIFDKKVTRNHSNGNELNYGKIKMENNGRCPFLNDQNLCRIYINIGESYLSNTCTFYPRVLNKIDGGYERSAGTSCPEIARIALLNPDGIQFEQVEESSSDMGVVFKTFETEGHLYMNKPQRYFWDIRMFSLSLLQNRSYGLGERLTILGIVYKKIDHYYRNSKMKELPKLLESMTYLIETGEFKEQLKDIPENPQIQLRLAKEMTDEKVLQGVMSQRYMECLNATLWGISFINGEPLETVMYRYAENKKTVLTPYLEEKEYILENYLVNTYFSEMMPFGKYKSMWDSYMFLCVLYGMVKLHLIGMSGYYKKMDDALMIQLLQSLSKIVLHNTGYILNMVDLLKNSELDSLAYMSILVKD